MVENSVTGGRGREGEGIGISRDGRANEKRRERDDWKKVDRDGRGPTRTDEGSRSPERRGERREEMRERRGAARG